MDSAVPNMNPGSLEYAPEHPMMRKPRVNVRMLIFAGVALLLIGFPIWRLVSHALNHGIVDHGTYKEVDLKSLGFFDFNDQTGSVNDVPACYRELDGKRVLLTGQWYDEHSSDRLTHFQMVYSIAKCCFGGPPKVQERVFCVVPNHGSVSAPPDPNHFCNVMGTLHVDLQKEAGIIRTVYVLDVERMYAAE